jgi:glycosyltransferase involved in cell wall biosynthesis
MLIASRESTQVNSGATTRGDGDEGSPRPNPAGLEVLTYSTLYPNAARPEHGIFVETRLRHLRASGGVDGEVIAPSPWFPFSTSGFGRYAAFARVPKRETRNGILVHHPRYPLAPKLGMTSAPFALYAATAPLLGRLLRQGRRFDLIDAHYFYPDGVAAVMLGQRFGLPVCITARGSDLSQIADYAMPRRMIQSAAARAAGLVTVCQALKQRLVELGVDDHRIRVLRNGVDLDLFHPRHRADARHRLGLDQPTLLSVGHLIERKRHDLVIRALARLRRCRLLIVGDGPLRHSLETIARDTGVADRVRFLGQVRQQQLPAIYAAADALVLSSSREGWANVLLEAMACGTPVVASNVWGNREVVSAPAAGILVDPCSAEGIADACSRLLSAPPPREATRAYAERYDWSSTTRGQLQLFSDIIGARLKAAA